MQSISSPVHLPEQPLSPQALLEQLKTIVGPRHLLTGEADVRPFSQGIRFGSGPVLAVAQPGSLVEQWRVLCACVAAGVIVIAQAANTGLTGGSSPDGTYDRPVVVISTRRLRGVHLLRQGAQVVCLPGSTLFDLETLLRPLGREPHSVIGSSCIGASVMGGICNNSGGALVRRGPAYTELTLYARVNEQGRLELINHLGIALGDDPETMLSRLESGQFTPAEISEAKDRSASDHGYVDHVRQIDADTPARFNADPARLFESSGSAGKVMIFAVRLDTFEKDKETRVFYIGTNDPAELTNLRRAILGNFAHLPVAGEYMHRTCFDIAARYGKDTYLAIRKLGTDRIPGLFAAKARIDGLSFIPAGLTDKVIQFISDLLPSHLPPRLVEWRDRYEHHLILRMADDGIAEAARWLGEHFPSATGSFFECTPEEAEGAFLHRFAAAGAANRYRAVHNHKVENIVALDIALPRNCEDWVEHLPPEIEQPILHKLYYGHFLCHVFHQDYIVAKGTDCVALEDKMLPLLDRRGAEYPAEHNVGHLYHAKPTLAAHYDALDPCNMFNPGIGHTHRDARPPVSA